MREGEMSESRNYVAVDLGAESGRLMLGTLAGEELTLQEMHRFSNGPVDLDGHLRWDFPRLLAEVKRGLKECVRRVGPDLAGIAVDSWGVDFGLLDADGRLIENPYNYRDSQTEGMLEEAFRRMPRQEIYEHTGIQFMRINSLYQLLALRLRNDAALSRAQHLVFIGDLFSCHLCGRVFAEYTLASTSQMMDMNQGAWSETVFKRLDLPVGILPEIVPPGTVLAEVLPTVAEEVGCGKIPVIAVGSHDTASAVAAVPAAGEDWAYISSGTWSLMGVELPKPVVNSMTYENDFTNEGGVNNTIRLLKNIMGLWLVQECRREWQRAGDDLTYAQLTEMAQQARPFAARINPDHGDFVSPGEMPDKISRCLRATGQDPIEDRGEMIRSILESLAFTYRKTLDSIEEATARHIEVIHIVGGGTQNELLNQFTANATGRSVVTGPIEATSIGNILMQARAVGQVGSLEDIRAVVRKSFPTKTYAPSDVSRWQDEYENWRTQCY